MDEQQGLGWVRAAEQAVKLGSTGSCHDLVREVGMARGKRAGRRLKRETAARRNGDSVSPVGQQLLHLGVRRCHVGQALSKQLHPRGVGVGIVLQPDVGHALQVPSLLQGGQGRAGRGRA